MKLFFFFFTLVLVKFKDYVHMISGLLASSKHEEGIWQKKARDIISHGELTSRLSRFFSLEGFLGWGAWKRPSILSCFQNRVSELWETHDKNRLEQPQTEIISTWGLPQKLRTAKKRRFLSNLRVCRPEQLSETPGVKKPVYPVVSMDDSK